MDTGYKHMEKFIQTVERKPDRQREGKRNQSQGSPGHPESGTGTSEFPHLPVGRCDWTGADGIVIILSTRRGGWRDEPSCSLVLLSLFSRTTP